MNNQEVDKLDELISMLNDMVKKDKPKPDDTEQKNDGKFQPIPLGDLPPYTPPNNQVKK